MKPSEIHETLRQRELRGALSALLRHFDDSFDERVAASLKRRHRAQWAAFWRAIRHILEWLALIAPIAYTVYRFIYE